MGNMREAGLPRNVVLIQVDFKENIEYPLSPNETSEEWHAQNKLSLTIFGANALVPSPLVAVCSCCCMCRNVDTSKTVSVRRPLLGTSSAAHREFFFLLCSEILDHDAQVGCMQKQECVWWRQTGRLAFAAAVQTENSLRDLPCHANLKMVFFKIEREIRVLHQPKHQSTPDFPWHLNGSPQGAGQ